jgi:peptide/nickel transport system substrate-binding protein
MVPTGLIALAPKPCPGDNVTGQTPRYDVANAEAMLDQAGWVKGADGTRAKNGKPLAFSVIFSPEYAPLDKPTAELLAQRWRAIGVRRICGRSRPPRSRSCCSRRATGTYTRE